jgi:fused signal recognition particle receptor
MFGKIKQALAKTRKQFSERLDRVFSVRGAPDAETLDRLEEVLISSDLGVETTVRLLDDIRRGVDRRDIKTGDALKDRLKQGLVEMLLKSGGVFDPGSAKPFVIMVVGVNGVGKTTTIAKMARRFGKEGRSVLLAAGDTFRAAAIEQLEAWGFRLDIPVIRQRDGADPSAVLFDAVMAARNRGTDVLIADTAGRLHTKSNLMEEIKKMKRVMGKALPGSPHEILLILDATLGQNGLLQARQFHETVGLTGMVLTKLDGTARGGIAVSVSMELGIPIRFVGVGEGVEDLEDFSPKEFVDGLFD